MSHSLLVLLPARSLAGVLLGWLLFCGTQMIGEGAFAVVERGGDGDAEEDPFGQWRLSIG